MSQACRKILLKAVVQFNICLLKAVIQSNIYACLKQLYNPIYCYGILPASFFRKGCLKSRFWWGQKSQEKKIHELSRPKFCMPKTMGGIGFQNLHSFNLAMLVKQGWRLYKNTHSVVLLGLQISLFPQYINLRCYITKTSFLTRTMCGIFIFIRKNFFNNI